MPRIPFRLHPGYTRNVAWMEAGKTVARTKLRKQPSPGVTQRPGQLESGASYRPPTEDNRQMLLARSLEQSEIRLGLVLKLLPNGPPQAAITAGCRTVRGETADWGTLHAHRLDVGVVGDEW